MWSKPCPANEAEVIFDERLVLSAIERALVDEDVALRDIVEERIDERLVAGDGCIASVFARCRATAGAVGRSRRSRVRRAGPSQRFREPEQRVLVRTKRLPLLTA